MLDKDNNNQGYLCGRLFAVLDKIQEDANNISSIRERYMNAASATPSAVFATILNLSVHHSENWMKDEEFISRRLSRRYLTRYQPMDSQLTLISKTKDASLWAIIISAKTSSQVKKNSK